MVCFAHNFAGKIVKLFFQWNDSARKNMGKWSILITKNKIKQNKINNNINRDQTKHNETS